MPEILGRLRTPRLPAAPASPVVGEMYYDTGTNGLYWWNATAWIASQPTFVSALPGSPVDGQEVYFQDTAMATAGVVWHLRYRAAGGTYKWEFLGGAPLVAYVDALEAPSTTGWAGTATLGPELTMTRAGEYELMWGAQIVNASGTAPDTFVGVSIGGSLPAGRDMLQARTPTNCVVEESKTARLTVGASTLVRVIYNTSVLGVSFGRRWLHIRPARLA